MDRRDVLQIIFLVVFWLACDRAMPESLLKKWTVIVLGFALLVIGFNNGFEAGKARAISDARESAILRSPEMPR